MKFQLTAVFESCRKAMLPTPEEKREREKQDKIREASTRLDLAVRGVRVGEISKEDALAASLCIGGIYGAVPHVPRPMIALTPAQQTFHIQKATEDLLNLDVDLDTIDAIVDHAKDCMENPKRTFLGYPESFD